MLNLFMRVSNYIKRRAVLVGCPGPADNFLNGVRHDLNNFPNYLKSDRGGKWDDSEITILNNPTSAELRFVVENAIADYTFIYFSGHGYQEIRTQTDLICLRDTDIPVLELLNKSPKQLVLVDACRNEMGYQISGVPEFETPFDDFSGSPVRELFDDCIRTSHSGAMIVYGTQPGCPAFDSRNGGVFTNALFKIAKKFDYGSTYNTVPLRTALEYVPLELLKKGKHQIPSIVFESGQLTVPFAISLPVHLNIHRTSANESNSFVSDGVNALSIILGGLLILGLLNAD
jgi:hypothetical protein